MTILKTNEIAKEYSTRKSFKLISDLLDRKCLESYQVAYNVLCMLWILSYHEFTYEYFEDYTLSIIEKVTKVMDYHSKEKIARIMLMLFDNLKDIPDCQDHLSEIDALNLIIKLQNRHWVDEDINKMLDDLYSYFEENQKVYSSIDKFKKQIERKQLRWGPCHTEKFWQENAYQFDNADNLKLIEKLVKDCLESEDDTVKAVACFDIGEFSKYYAHGKRYLEKFNIRMLMTQLMANQTVSAEVKKEAITCYQKLLMGSWSNTTST